MKKLLTLIKIEFKLAVREFSGVLFGVLLPLGIMALLGIIYGDREAFEGAGFTLVQQAFPAVAAIGICTTGLMGIPLSISMNREKKILKHLKVTPAGPAVLLAAQFVNNLIFAVLSALLVTATSVLFFNYSLPGRPLYFILSYMLVLTSIYSLGMMIASISPDMKRANLLTTLFYFPMFFLSGATIPFEIMPSGLQKISSIMPLTQGIMLLKRVSLQIDGDMIVKPIVVLSLTAVIGIIISLKSFRWE